MEARRSRSLQTCVVHSVVSEHVLTHLVRRDLSGDISGKLLADECRRLAALQARDRDGVHRGIGAAFEIVIAHLPTPCGRAGCQRVRGRSQSRPSIGAHRALLKGSLSRPSAPLPPPPRPPPTPPLPAPPP